MSNLLSFCFEFFSHSFPPYSSVISHWDALLDSVLLLVVQKNLEIGEVLAVDVSSIVAVTSTVNIQIKYNGPARRTMFGVSSF